MTRNAQGNGRVPKRRPVRADRESGVPLPRRPYRDSVLFYAVLSGVIVVVAWLTGGRILPGELWRDPDEGPPEVGALLVAVAFFAVATGWAWWRFRKQLALRERR